MIWLKLITLVIVASTTLGDFFQEAALKGKKSCDECSRNDCLTYHEAFEDKCKDVCKKKIDGPDDGGGGGSTAAPQQSTTAGGGDDGSKKKGGGGGGCFHGDDTVITTNGEMKLRDLVGREDVRVLSRSDDNKFEFSPVYSWLHADAKKESGFIIFTTESGHRLSITSQHLIYETDCNGNSKTVFAGKVKVGGCLYINDDGEFKETKVVDKHHETKVGIFAPITENGNLVVSGVLASCFTSYEDETFQRIIYSTLHTISRMAGKVLPSSLIELVSNSPFNSMVHVPEAFMSFLDLHKIFMK